MPILNINPDLIGQSGAVPKVISIATNDTTAQVQVVGYLNSSHADGIPLADIDIAFVSTKLSPSAVASSAIICNVVYANGNWSLVKIAGS